MQAASDLASGCQDSAVYTILLGLLLKGGPLRQELSDCGLSEGLVIAVDGLPVLKIKPKALFEPGWPGPARG